MVVIMTIKHQPTHLWSMSRCTAEPGLVGDTERPEEDLLCTVWALWAGQEGVGGIMCGRCG